MSEHEKNDLVYISACVRYLEIFLCVSYYTFPHSLARVCISLFWVTYFCSKQRSSSILVIATFILLFEFRCFYPAIDVISIFLYSVTLENIIPEYVLHRCIFSRLLSSMLTFPSCRWSSGMICAKPTSYNG